MATIFHLALASDWAAAEASGAYTVSTLGRTLAEEGFIHASRADQWTAVRARFYAEVSEPLLLLQINTDLLDVPVIEEPAVAGGTETFPHIYGPLAITAVIKAIAVPSAKVAAAAAAAAPPPAQPAPVLSEAVAAAAPAAPTAPAGPAGPTESFSRVYFREMFFNMGVVCIALVTGTIGVIVGDGIGGIIGVAIGAVIAVLVYRRRHRAEIEPA